MHQVSDSLDIELDDVRAADLIYDYIMVSRGGATFRSMRAQVFDIFFERKIYAFSSKKRSRIL
jgi:hypothetical protein